MNDAHTELPKKQYRCCQNLNVLTPGIEHPASRMHLSPVRIFSPACNALCCALELWGLGLLCSMLR